MLTKVEFHLKRSKTDPSFFKGLRVGSLSSFSVFFSYSYEIFLSFLYRFSIFSCARVCKKMLLERDRDAKEMLDSSRTFAEKNLRERIGVGGNIFLFITIGSCFKYFVHYNVFIKQLTLPE